VGTDSLPVVMVNGEIVSQSVYPTREDLQKWVTHTPKKHSLTISQSGGEGCGGSGCC
jgi:hypothetical protein